MCSSDLDSFLKNTLLDARPDYGWLSEETIDSTSRLSKERVWIVDPLDGTKEFIEGVSQFVVSVGLVQMGNLLLAFCIIQLQMKLFMEVVVMAHF